MNVISNVCHKGTGVECLRIIANNSNALNIDLAHDRSAGCGIFHAISRSQLRLITNHFTASLTQDAVVLQTIPEESGKSQLLMNKPARLWHWQLTESFQRSCSFDERCEDEVGKVVPETGKLWNIRCPKLDLNQCSNFKWIQSNWQPFWTSFFLISKGIHSLSLLFSCFRRWLGKWLCFSRVPLPTNTH